MAVADIEGADLCRRLRADDAVAPAELCLAYLDDLARWLTARHPRADPHDCQTAAADALLALIKNPAAYKPVLRSLRGYLQMAATGDLLNLLASARRHTGRSRSFEDVEHSSEAGKLVQEDGDPAEIVAHREDEAPAVIGLPVLPSDVQAALTEEEQQVRELMWLRERKTTAYAAVLHIADRPIEEQRREVKRVKDRINMRLKRAGVSDG
jgi:RNA polymerase sigma-70 factor (ECF subfamily)